MKMKWVVMALLLALAFFLQATFACGDDDDDQRDGDDDTSDDDDDNDDDDIYSDDDIVDDDDDDTGDDDTGDDDTGDDDTEPETPTYSSNHESDWFCYTCHEIDFNGAPGEPHDHFYEAPDQCNLCHSADETVTQPNGPDGHLPNSDCLTCHSDEHDKDWQEKAQCLLCHGV